MDSNAEITNVLILFREIDSKPTIISVRCFDDYPEAQRQSEAWRQLAEDHSSEIYPVSLSVAYQE